MNRIIRPATTGEKHRHAEIRTRVMNEFPPGPNGSQPNAPPGIPAQIRAAREARGLTWYALAKQAGIPSSNTVHDIATGQDVTLSNVQAVAAVLGLRLELVAHAEDSAS